MMPVFIESWPNGELQKTPHNGIKICLCAKYSPHTSNYQNVGREKALRLGVSPYLFLDPVMEVNKGK
jgi:hypothetical protein